MLHNIAGLISEFAEDVECPGNPCFELPHCRLTTPLHETPANIRTNLILPETSSSCSNYVDLATVELGDNNQINN